MPTYKYPRPAVTVDVVLLRPGEGPTTGPLEILLIQRKVDPFAGHWALPGGFLDLDEELETAARRELLEETGVRVGRLLPLQVYAKVGRDPRGRTVSVAFVALDAGRGRKTVAGDDAVDVAWEAVANLPKMAFDHRKIVRDGLARCRELVATGEIATLLRPTFTWSRLRAFQAALAPDRKPPTRAQLLRREAITETGRTDRHGEPLYRAKGKR